MREYFRQADAISRKKITHTLKKKLLHICFYIFLLLIVISRYGYQKSDLHILDDVTSVIAHWHAIGIHKVSRYH